MLVGHAPTLPQKWDGGGDLCAPFWIRSQSHESGADDCGGRPGGIGGRNIAIPALTAPFSVPVRLHAAGVNPIDTKVPKNNMYYPDKLPSILGCDGAGVVKTVGTSVTRVRPGDEVYFFNNGLGGQPSTYAE
jgi:NADPH:quinone reductase